MYQPMDNPDGDEDAGLEWYINTIFKSRTSKVQHFVHQESCKIRLMKDLVRQSTKGRSSQTVMQNGWAEDRAFTMPTYSSVLDATELEVNVNSCSQSVKMVSSPCDSQGEGFENMTLKEMHQLLKSSTRKSFKKRHSEVLSSQHVPVIESNLQSDSSTCLMQVGSSILHVASSNLNITASADDYWSLERSSLRDVQGQKAEFGTMELESPKLSSKKRMFALGPEDQAPGEDDDDWTLEMWRSYKKKKSHDGKKLKRHADEQVCNPNCEVASVHPSTSGSSWTITKSEVDVYPDSGSVCSHNCTRVISNSEATFSVDFSGSLISRNLEGQDISMLDRDLKMLGCKAMDRCGRDDEKHGDWAMANARGSSADASMEKFHDMESSLSCENYSAINSCSPFGNGSFASDSSLAVEALEVPIEAQKSSECLDIEADLSRKTNIDEASIGAAFDSSSPFQGAEVELHGNTNISSFLQSVNEEGNWPFSLFTTEKLDSDDEQGPEHHQPSKIPCARKAISPLTRERLLQASESVDCKLVCRGFGMGGMKKLPGAFKGFIGRDSLTQVCSGISDKTKNIHDHDSSSPTKSNQKEEGSPCHNREKLLPSKFILSKVSSTSPPYGDSVAGASGQTSSPSATYVERLPLVLNNSPSPPSNGKSPVSSSPRLPTKGILRSGSPTCQGICKCEECVSLRKRAERAAEFSQRQMHDIEGLAVKLLKELNTMRGVLEEGLIHKSAPKTDSPQTAWRTDKVRKAAQNALETEKKAKTWLVRMARDCNRYCRIMRMQERKLSFADESGGQLCHVKLIQPKPHPRPLMFNSVREKTLSGGHDNLGSS